MPGLHVVRHELMMNTYLEECLCLGPIFLVRESGIHTLHETEQALM